LIISSLVRKLSGQLNNPLIRHIPYKSVVDAVGGEEEFCGIALNVIDPRVRALQGKLITVEKLDSIRVSQSQESNPWPHSNGGYLDYVTNLRDKDYWRPYVGQSSDLAQRIPQHCRAIRLGKSGALHYYIITKKPAADFRLANFIRLWVIESPWETDDLIIHAFENFLEMTFARAFQTMAPTILEEYFGPCPDGTYSNVGLNVVPPLMQGRELAPTVCGNFVKLLESSQDPEIREWPEVRAREQREFKPKASKGRITAVLTLTPEQYINCLHDAIKTKPNTSGSIAWPAKEKVPWMPQRNEQGLVDLKTWYKRVSDKNICESNNLVAPVGTVAASIGIVLDSVPCHDYGNNIFLPWGLTESGFTQENSLIWIANFQKYIK
ncbi:hypothetical protein N7474_000327, partial [Penicillium riverlandense]|uniref:uncharacterized protein n=1 Tax=Penicillium riverlandense TaxID=1903569 RepID=UPI002547359B